MEGEKWQYSHGRLPELGPDSWEAVDMALLAGFVPAGVWMTRFAMRIAAQELRCRIEAPI